MYFCSPLISFTLQISHLQRLCSNAVHTYSYRWSLLHICVWYYLPVLLQQLHGLVLLRMLPHVAL